MRPGTRTHIFLSPEELRLVVALQAELGAKSRIEVVRRGLRLLKDTTDRESLREAYRRASAATRAAALSVSQELGHLAVESPG